MLSKYGEEESFAFACSGDGEDGDCGESGDSTGDGSSSRIEISDGEVVSAMAMRALRLYRAVILLCQIDPVLESLYSARHLWSCLITEKLPGCQRDRDVSCLPLPAWSLKFCRFLLYRLALPSNSASLDLSKDYFRNQATIRSTAQQQSKAIQDLL